MDLHKGYFNIPVLEHIMRGLAYGDVWSLYRRYKDPSPTYASFLISLNRDFDKENDDILTSIVGRVIKEIYLEEMRIWSDEVEISDLIRPFQYTLGDGANIDAKTRTALLSTGMRTAHDLASLTREEICQIPGMTTEGVVKLEKSLALRRIFLKNQVPSF